MANVQDNYTGGVPRQINNVATACLIHAASRNLKKIDDTLINDRFHTATNPKTNLARCFDCEKNFNPIDLVIAVTNCSFVDAVERLKKRSHWIV